MAQYRYISRVTLKKNTNITLESLALSRKGRGRGRPILHSESASKFLFRGFKFKFEEVGLRPHPSLLVILSDE